MQVQLPQKIVNLLFTPKRYKVAYGGRGGAKSWGFARALLVKGTEEGKPIRVLCAREYQNSIADSVHKLLSDQIVTLGLSDHYEVLNASIRGKNGTEFVFAGIKRNIDNIKSFEGFDIVWIEEAANVSKTSWDKLIPTIRKDDSEIWVSFNPELDTDETYKRFVVRPPTESNVIKVNWSDNPWFPKVLDQERLDLKAKNEDEYLNVWEGHCKQMLEGAIYAEEMRDATKAGRITKVPYNEAKPVSTYWDLGHSDKTAIWFIQRIGYEWRVIDYFEDNQQKIPYYLKELQSRAYVYERVYLPHDAAANQLSAEKTIEGQIRAAGYKVIVIPRMAKKSVGINAVRTIFSNCYFDEEKCADGLQCLRRYKYEVDPDTGQFSREPLHDVYSNGADAFAQFALAAQEPKNTTPMKPKLNMSGYPREAGAWMGR